MREIKFRGLTLNREWVYGLLAKKGNELFISNSFGKPFAFKVRPETVGEFTGGIDCKGKEIYEGDKDSRGYVIMFSKKHLCFCQHYYQEYFENWSEASYPLCANSIEITGNVFDTI